MMTLEELTSHTANVRDLLEIKRRQLSRLDQSTAVALTLKDQIEKLDPRVTELEGQCTKMIEVREAALLGFSVPPVAA